MPTEHEALFDLAFDLYEQQENRQAFAAAFRERVATDPTARRLFLEYACDRLIRGITQECSRQAKAIPLDRAITADRPPRTPVDTEIDPKQATSREVFSEALQKYEHQRQQQQQQREAMETMVDESIERHQQHPNDFAEGDHVLLIAGPGSEEIPGTVVSITPEQVIVHFELIDGSIMEYPLSPQALQKQQSASDEELQP